MRTRSSGKRERLDFRYNNPTSTWHFSAKKYLPMNWPRFEMMHLGSTLILPLMVCLIQGVPPVISQVGQGITPLVQGQIHTFKPYSFYASTGYCPPAETLAWSCGANCEGNPNFQPIASGGDGNVVPYCQFRLLYLSSNHFWRNDRVCGLWRVVEHDHCLSFWDKHEWDVSHLRFLYSVWVCLPRSAAHPCSIMLIIHEVLWIRYFFPAWLTTSLRMMDLRTCNLCKYDLWSSECVIQTSY